jgi:GntR family transcriptional regulator, arabinose operon transcriptional repressor
MSRNGLHTYQRIKLALLDEIKDGTYQLDRPFITESEICRRFEVSRATAIRALNDLVHDGVVSRQRGRGTFVNAPPTGVPDGRPPNESTRLIGCIIDQLHGNHPMAIVRGIENVCRDADYHLLLFDSDGSAHTEALNLARARNVGVHGLIVYPVDGYANTARFEALLRDAVPLVLIDRYYPALPTNSVVADDFAVGYELTEILIRQGHRDIAIILPQVTCTSVVDRLAGYVQAHKLHGVPIKPELAALRPYSILPAEERRARLTSWLNAPYRPTAYLAINSDVDLATVSTDLIALGVHIPEEATMASMDNANLDVVRASGAMSITLPSYEVGATAMRILLDRFSGGTSQPLRHVILPVTVSASVNDLPRLQLSAR